MWKGETSYFSIGGAANLVLPDETPKVGAEGIAGCLAFYPAVRVERVLGGVGACPDLRLGGIHLTDGSHNSRLRKTCVC